MPSKSAANCVGDSRITPSVGFGQAARQLSSLLTESQNAVLFHKKI